MNLIACVEDNMGMMFNHRRESQDGVLRDEIVRLAKGKKLWMDEYSAKQFEDHQDDITVDEWFMEKAGPGDYCFVEKADPALFKDKIEKIILYRWNRSYPADKYFDIPLDHWKLVSTRDFPGSSHEKITEEIYEPAE